MPKVTDEHREAMKLRIQDAALTCLSHKGFSAVSMADIIAQAQLSAGAVYLYYRSKEQLILDVGQRVMVDRLSVLKDLRDRTPLPSPAEAMAIIFTEISQGPLTPGLPVQVWGESVGHPGLRGTAGELLSLARTHIAAYVAAWLSQERHVPDHLARERAEELAPALLGLVQGFMVQLSLSDAPGKAATQYCAAVSRLLGDL